MSELEKDETPVPTNPERNSDTNTAVETPSPEIDVVYDADDGDDAPNPTVPQIFDQEKSGLLDDIRLLLRLVSDMELDDHFDESLSFYELPSIARRILRRLKRIGHLDCVVRLEFDF